MKGQLLGEKELEVFGSGGRGFSFLNVVRVADIDADQPLDSIEATSDVAIFWCEQFFFKIHNWPRRGTVHFAIIRFDGTHCEQTTGATTTRIGKREPARAVKGPGSF
jgi:hypothetical protein